MGTETKSNSYTGQISTSGGNPKVMKDSLSLVRQAVKQQQSNQINLNSNSNTNPNPNSNSNTNSNSITYSSEQQQQNNTGDIDIRPAKQEDNNTRSIAKDTVVPFVPIFVEEADVIQGAKDILKVIRPNWDLNHVDFKVI